MTTLSAERIRHLAESRLTDLPPLSAAQLAAVALIVTAPPAPGHRERPESDGAPRP